ncbi:DNA-directed RNA polymerase II subunit RPB1 [Hordeum vulgare]|nr:DNA-directed RNA polymerase II subunit RPB1 [Hordeum vulgare]
MQEVEEIKENWEEELHVDEDEVEKSMSIEESVVEYQSELWRSHYYEYYKPERSNEDEDKDNDVVGF